ncbi:MAG TPA: hypothetical protein VGV14_18635, partial [Rhodanobacter sp.]|nr:hypothetical protein [Rhodanobacter sp.]
MSSKLADDRRIDPRIKAMFGAMPAEAGKDVASREELLANENTPESKAAVAAMTAMFDMAD